MNTKTIVTIIVLAVLIGGGFLILNQQRPAGENEYYNEYPDSNAGDTDVPPVNDDVGAPSAGSPTTSESPEAPAVPAPSTVEVMYTPQGFSPSVVTIAKGDTVRFVNESGSTMWVASAKHPTHTVYDGTALSEHCTASGASSSFDQCQAGDEYSFTFEKTGTWTYHDHVHPSNIGKVIVE